jgi:hypothetical protein
VSGWHAAAEALPVVAAVPLLQPVGFIPDSTYHITDSVILSPCFTTTTEDDELYAGLEYDLFPS